VTNNGMAAFTGAKVALFVGPDLVTLLRDDKPGLPWADMWDLPGGGREGDETPLACALRETREEVGLNLRGVPVLWQRAFASQSQPGSVGWFFVIALPAAAQSLIRLGDEGQEWRLTPPAAYLTHPAAIPFLQARLRMALAEGGPFA